MFSVKTILKDLIRGAEAKKKNVSERTCQASVVLYIHGASHHLKMAAAKFGNAANFSAARKLKDLRGRTDEARV